MAYVAVPLCLFRLSKACMAFIPKGVAALPKPRMFDDMFIIMALMAGWSPGTSGKSRVITGFSLRAITLKRPAFSATFIKPNHRGWEAGSKPLIGSAIVAMAPAIVTVANVVGPQQSWS